MSFDPNLPQENTLIDAAQMRAQLNGLKALMDAIVTVTGAQVDAVNTLPPGSNADASVTVGGSTLHFTFGIPQGSDGAQGQNGSDGAPGQAGPQGPPFANAVVDNVNTLPAGSNAGVSVSFDGMNVHFTFDIPQGADGATGPQGLPGEVTQTDLNNAVAQMTSDSSANSNAVSTLGMTVSDPPTQSEVQQIADKLDELINALRR